MPWIRYVEWRFDSGHALQLTHSMQNIFELRVDLPQPGVGVSFLEELHHPVTPRTSYQPGIVHALDGHICDSNHG
jgi:hypothetical protein